MSPQQPPFEGWMRYQELVLAELARHSEYLERINSAMNTINIKLVRIQTRHKLEASLWGLVGATIPIALSCGWEIIKARR